MDVKKKIIFIIGQHRSGSSLLSGLFKIFGSYIGKIETPDVDKFNPKGYFENNAIEKINDHMLKSIGTNWSLARDIAEEHYTQLLTSDYPDKLKNILLEDIKLNDNPLLVIKDPRISLLLPIYFKVLKEIENIEYGFIITQRPADEISDSLKRAQKLAKERSLSLIRKYEDASKKYIKNHTHLWVSVFDCVAYKPIKFIKYLDSYFNMGLTINDATIKKANDFIDMSLKNFSVKRNCKVISAYYGPKRFSDLEGMVEILNRHINSEKQLDSGCFNDIIIVNHENNFNMPRKEEFYKLLDDIDGTPSRNGVFKVIHRPFQDGVGGSYCSFNYAFEKFKDDYEYWFFTEDNVIITHEHIFKKCIEQLQQNPKVKYIGCLRYNNQVPPSHKKNERHPEHLHGGCGCVNIKDLQEVYNKFGKLPYSERPMTESMLKRIHSIPYEFKNRARAPFMDGEWSAWYKDFENQGEVMFTNAYVQMGHELDVLNYEPRIVHWLHIMDKKISIEHIA